MYNEINLQLDILPNERKIYLGNEDGSGATYDYKDIKDLANKIEFYLENYYKNFFEEVNQNEFLSKEIELLYNVINIDILRKSDEFIKWCKENNYNNEIEKETLQQELDRRLEYLWDKFEDIPFSDFDSEERLECKFAVFEAETDKEEIWHWFDKRHSKGVHYLLYEYEIGNNNDNRQKVSYTQIMERISKEQKCNDLFYYEIRNCDGVRYIERNVLVDFEESFVTDFEILGDKEFIEEQELFNDKNIILLDDSDIYEKVMNTIENYEEQDEEI